MMVKSLSRNVQILFNTKLEVIDESIPSMLAWRYQNSGICWVSVSDII